MSNPIQLLVTVTREPNTRYLYTVTVRNLTDPESVLLYISAMLHGTQRANNEAKHLCSMLRNANPAAEVSYQLVEEN